MIVGFITGAGILIIFGQLAHIFGIHAETVDGQDVQLVNATMKRLVDKTGATHVGAEMDPSHLMWQGMDVPAVIRFLGPLVLHAAAPEGVTGELVLDLGLVEV